MRVGVAAVGRVDERGRAVTALASILGGLAAVVAALGGAWVWRWWRSRRPLLPMPLPARPEPQTTVRALLERSDDRARERAEAMRSATAEAERVALARIAIERPTEDDVARAEDELAELAERYRARQLRAEDDEP